MSLALYGTEQGRGLSVGCEAVVDAETLLAQSKHKYALHEQSAQEEECTFSGWVAEETGAGVLDNFDVFLGSILEEMVVQDCPSHLCRLMLDW